MKSILVKRCVALMMIILLSFPVSAQAKTVKATDGEIKLLAALVQYEAGVNYRGNLAVANVVLNRKKSCKFPNTIKKVIYQPHQFGTVSWSGVLRKFLKHPNKTCLRAVKDALRGKNNIGKRLYFRSTKTVKYHKNNLSIGGNTFF